MWGAVGLTYFLFGSLDLPGFAAMRFCGWYPGRDAILPQNAFPLNGPIEGENVRPAPFHSKGEL
jgi:hypothetical protein